MAKTKPQPICSVSDEICTKVAAKKIGFTIAKKNMFLEKLSNSCNVQQSAEYAGVSVDTVYQHRKKDDVFRKNWAQAIEIAFDELMLEMLRRARFGTKKTIVYGGKATDVFTEVNDSMGMRLLSLHMAKVAEHKLDNGDDMNKKDDTHSHLMQKLADIKMRLRKRSDNELKHCEASSSTHGVSRKE